jgi:hypothetical protein
VTLNIKCATWDEDILFLSTPNNLITTARVFSQALIHSNLFDGHLNKHGNLTDLTLSEMADKKFKKPFACTVIEGICLYVTIVYNVMLYVINVYL